jgi:hypothetical protein
VPGFGFYCFGLIHLVGAFAKSGTSILRQLVDAGTLANLPGGFKTRGLRVKVTIHPIGPAEWRDVDVPSGTIADNIMALPYKEPSQVLALFSIRSSKKAASLLLQLTSKLPICLPTLPLVQHWPSLRDP